MKLTDGEKLIVLMLSEIYDSLGKEGELDPAFIRSAIFGDHLWALAWKYPGIPFAERETPPIVAEVVDILDMWSFIERSYSMLSDEDKESLKVSAAPFGDNPKFVGFDGNNESEHMGIAQVLINDLDRFSEFKGRSLNSHFPSLEVHHRMLQEFLPMRRNLRGEPLSLRQLDQILKSKIHPEHR